MMFVLWIITTSILLAAITVIEFMESTIPFVFLAIVCFPLAFALIALVWWLYLRHLKKKYKTNDYLQFFATSEGLKNSITLFTKYFSTPKLILISLVLGFLSIPPLMDSELSESINYFDYRLWIGLALTSVLVVAAFKINFFLMEKFQKYLAEKEKKS